MLSEVGLGFERLGPAQQRAITFLWAATQVAARVVRGAFLHIYSSLPDSENGHTSLKDYCSLAGRASVYLELLDDGYMTDVLSSSPKESTFLDLKVTRMVLDKVLSERFGKDKYWKLSFEVRQLVYLRNDLCHQLLPALTREEYLSRMKQLETRLCVVVSEAALIAGTTRTPDKALQDIHALFASLMHRKKTQTDNGTQTYFQLPAALETDTHTPNKALQDIHALFVSLLHHDKPQTDTTTPTNELPAMAEMNIHNPDDALPDHHHHQKPRAEIGIQTDFHSPDTFEKGTQARMDSQQPDMNEGMFGEAGKNTSTNSTTSDSQYLGTYDDAGQNTEHIISSPKNSADPERFSVFSRFRGLAGGKGKTRGVERIGKGERQGKQEGKKQEKHEECCGACPFSLQSPIKSPQTDGINWKGGRRLHRPYGTQSVTRKGPHGQPGHSLCHGELVTLKKVTYEAVTVNHVFVKVQNDDRLPLDIILSLVLKVILFLAVLIVSMLPLAITLLRVMLDGVQYSWNNADRAYSYLWDLCYGPTKWHETMCVSEVVLIPRLEPVEIHGPAISPHQLRDFGMDYLKADRKAGCRRKGRKN